MYNKCYEIERKAELLKQLYSVNKVIKELEGNKPIHPGIGKIDQFAILSHRNRKSSIIQELVEIVGNEVEYYKGKIYD